MGIQPPTGEPPYPQLTLGWLLLALKRAEINAETVDERAEVVRLSKPLADIHKQWRFAWDRKATQEFKARLKLWRDFLEEYRSNPDQNYDRYSYEVSRRVLLELLDMETIEISQAEKDLLMGLDKVLRTVLVRGEFIWDKKLVSGFPRTRFWFLFGKLPKQPATIPH